MIDLRKYITSERQSEYYRLLEEIHKKSAYGGFSEWIDADFDFDFLNEIAPTLNNVLLCSYEAEDLIGGYLSQPRSENECINPIVYQLLTCFFDEAEFSVNAVQGENTQVANYFLDSYYEDPEDSAFKMIAEDIADWYKVSLENKEYLRSDDGNYDGCYGGCCILRFSDKCDIGLIKYLMRFLPFEDAGDGSWCSYTFDDYEGVQFQIGLDIFDESEVLQLLEAIPDDRNNAMTSDVEKFISVLDLEKQGNQSGTTIQYIIDDIFKIFHSETEVLL